YDHLCVGRLQRLRAVAILRDLTGHRPVKGQDRPRSPRGRNVSLIACRRIAMNLVAANFTSQNFIAQNSIDMELAPAALDLGIEFDAERPGDAPAREKLLDRAMGRRRKRKTSETLRRGRRPAEGLALCARDGAGSVVGTVRLWHVAVGGRPA